MISQALSDEVCFEISSRVYSLTASASFFSAIVDVSRLQNRRTDWIRYVVWEIAMLLSEATAARK